MSKKTKNILGIEIQSNKKNNILEKIILYTRNPSDFFHVVSLNPENIVVAQKREEFKHVLNTADVQIIDGIGVKLAGSILGIDTGDRLTGVDLTQLLLHECEKEPLRVMFLGSKPNIAEDIAKCYQKKYPQCTFLGIQGIENIYKPKNEEEIRIFSIVADIKPHILFASFGSPAQELWFHRHKEQLQGIVCIGVGGTFDFLSGNVKRAPMLIRKIGMEWLFRLVVEPWRWKRQLRLIRFLYLVLKQKIYKV